MSDSDNGKIVLKKNGDLVLTEDGSKTTVATYNADTRTLEFATKLFSEKHYNACVTAVGTESKGTLVSTNGIRSLCVKGEKRPDLKDAPKRPRLGELGDSASDIVEWYLTYDMGQAIIRYGLYTDSKGKPVRRKVKRIVETVVDNRDMDDVDLEARKDGRSSTVKAPVNRLAELVEVDNAYIARRATALTFIPQEVVGGFQPDDDFEEAHVQSEDSE